MRGLAHISIQINQIMIVVRAFDDGESLESLSFVEVVCSFVFHRYFSHDQKINKYMTFDRPGARCGHFTFGTTHVLAVGTYTEYLQQSKIAIANVPCTFLLMLQFIYITLLPGTKKIS